jgi:hypothetical protein
MIKKLIILIFFLEYCQCGSVTTGMTISQTCGTTIYNKIGPHPLAGRRYGNRIGKFTFLGRGYDLLKGGQTCLNSFCEDTGFR